MPGQGSRLRSQGVFRYFGDQYIIVGMMHEWECMESSASTAIVHMANGEHGLQLTSTGQAISDFSLSCIGLAIHPT